MDQILSKISSYNIFNYLFPGAVFAVIADRFGLMVLRYDNVAEQLLWYYFIGLAISRFGSIVLEPILKVLSVVRYSEYRKYLRACAADPDMDTMIEVANTYRTLAATFALLLIGLGYKTISRWAGIHFASQHILIVGLLLVLFLLAFRKQSVFVAKRVDHFGGS